jgi:hypothetical protein
MQDYEATLQYLHNVRAKVVTVYKQQSYSPARKIRDTK